MSSHQPGSLGLIVTAKPTYYPIELSNAELLSHYETVQEYQQDVISDMLATSHKYKPSTKLIDQQPEMNPHQTRSAIVTFLYELSVMTRVTNGIFFQAVRLYDRYCSKRVVLKDQAKLVVATCLWLAAKTWGGCNHIINNVVIPTGGRFYGPNPRARIPRLSELVHYCGGSDIFDESMFLQMEKHILDTLNWEILEAMINDYVLNVDENCLIQYELYERQIEHKNQMLREVRSQSSGDSDATVDYNEDGVTKNDSGDVSGGNHQENPAAAALNDEEDEDLRLKIELINLKKFLIDLSAWQYNLLDFDLSDVAYGIFAIINRFTDQDQGPFLATPTPSIDDQHQLLNIFINAVVNVPISLIEVYRHQKGVMPFIKNVTEYHLELQKKLQLASSMDMSKRMVANGLCHDNSTIPSPVYSSSSLTPMRNTSSQSENSIFSTIMGQASPITPTMYTFQDHEGNSSCNSSISVASLPGNNRLNVSRSNNSTNSGVSNSSSFYGDSNKENRPELHQVPPRAKFINDSFLQSPTSGASSNRSSLISLAVANTNTMV